MMGECKTCKKPLRSMPCDYHVIGAGDIAEAPGIENEIFCSEICIVDYIAILGKKNHNEAVKIYRTHCLEPESVVRDTYGAPLSY